MTSSTCLRHRPPFLFVDRITAVDLKQGASAATAARPRTIRCSTGRSPALPVYPGVLQVETMGQMGCACCTSPDRKPEHHPGAPSVDVRFLKIHYAQFMAEVGPGAQLDILAQVVERDDCTVVCAGQLLRATPSPASASWGLPCRQNRRVVITGMSINTPWATPGRLSWGLLAKPLRAVELEAARHLAHLFQGRR